MAMERASINGMWSNAKKSLLGKRVACCCVGVRSGAIFGRGWHGVTQGPKSKRLATPEAPTVHRDHVEL
jgi:hypothetical protein